MRVNARRDAVLVADHVIDPAAVARARKGESSILGTTYPGTNPYPPSSGPAGARRAIVTSYSHLNELGELSDGSTHLTVSDAADFWSGAHEASSRSASWDGEPGSAFQTMMCCSGSVPHVSVFQSSVSSPTTG